MVIRRLYRIGLLLAIMFLGACIAHLGGGYRAVVVFLALWVFSGMSLVVIRYRSLLKHMRLDDSIYFIITDTDEIRIIGCSQENVGEWLDAVCSENGKRLAKNYSEFMEAPGSVMILKGTVLDYDPREPGIEKSASHFK